MPPELNISPDTINIRININSESSQMLRVLELRLKLTMQWAFIDNLILVRVILEDQALSVQRAYGIAILYKAKIM